MGLKPKSFFHSREHKTVENFDLLLLNKFLQKENFEKENFIELKFDFHSQCSK